MCLLQSQMFQIKNRSLTKIVQKWAIATMLVISCALYVMLHLNVTLYTLHVIQYILNVIKLYITRQVLFVMGYTLTAICFTLNVKY